MSKINQKILTARKRLLECDWTPDAQYSRPGPKGMPQTIHYVSADKIKRNYVPLFAEIGLDYKVDMRSIQVTEKGGYTLKADVVLTDLESDEQDYTYIISEAPTQDKGCAIALTNVMRMYFASRFGIVDGIEYDDDRDERAELTAVLASKAVEPVTDVPAKAPQIPEIPNNPVKTVSEHIPPVVKPSKLSKMEENACSNIIAYLDKHKDTIEPAIYNHAREIYDKRADSSDVMALMEIKRDVESKQRAVTEGM